MALAQFAGQTVAGAAITDIWEAARGRFARLLGRGDTRKTEVAEQWLAQTHQQLTTAAGAGLEQAREAQSQRWAGRFADLLDEDPGVEAELRALVEEIAAQLPAQQLFPVTQNEHEGDVQDEHVEPDIPGVYPAVRAHGGGVLLTVSRRAALAASSWSW